MTSSDLFEFADSILALMPRMLRGIMREERDLVSDGLISLPKFLALQLIGERESCLMRELASDLRIAPSSVTAWVDRLAQLGLAQRNPDPLDRRAIRVSLTPQGQKALKNSGDKRREIAMRLFSEFSAADRETCRKVLVRVADQLNWEKQKRLPCE